MIKINESLLNEINPDNDPGEEMSMPRCMLPGKLVGNNHKIWISLGIKGSNNKDFMKVSDNNFPE